MARFSYPVSFLVSHLLLLSLAEEESKINPICPLVFPCGNLGRIYFPFSNRTHPECGLLVVDDCDKPVPKIQLGKDGPWYNITSISQDFPESNTVSLHDQAFQDHLKMNSCESLKNLTLPSSPSLSLEIKYNLTLFKCTHKLENNPTDFNLSCGDSIIYYNQTSYDDLPSLPPQCSLIQLPMNKTRQSPDLFNLLTGEYSLEVHVTRACLECHGRGGRCLEDSKEHFRCNDTRECHECLGRGGQCLSDSLGKFHCSDDAKIRLRLGLGIGFGIGVPILLVVALFMIFRHKKQYASASLHSGNSSSIPSSNSDLETGTVYFGVHIFSYNDLAEATNNFNHDKELGDGGFGTVYYGKNKITLYEMHSLNILLNGLSDPFSKSGKLKDGREVAVKRLYEHNYRRVEQFMNEIKILTCLHHKNLVPLYGCTSRHSRGLLLVYEFVPNGTVADHLHGDRAEPGLLTWPIRLNIAIETASALAYLHASDIIHRDVKTDNILLDNNFCVKVADFGLSRLFPNDVTHISTAPQGTPGYVDPEYHQCYQLTSKSDVYSFGVVLIELISSMPAVDISRHRNEINLANLAINRIQKHAVDELIDPCLGYHLDEEVKRKATLVAELAFKCLQQDKEMRPSMDVVLEELQRIQSGEPNFEDQKKKQDDVEVLKNMQPPPSPPYYDDAALLKHMGLPSSPISVAEKWVSSGTTPNVSC